MKHLHSLLLIAVLALFASPPAYCQLTDPSLAADGDKGFVVAGVAPVASVTVGTAGTGYTSPPTVAFSGGSGSVQATGTATLKVVGSVTVTAGGTGYTVGDVLTVQGGTRTTAATLTVSTVSSGVITAVTISNAGVYTAIPTNAASVTGGTGTGATFTLGYGVGTVVLSTAGAGYTSAPTVAFSGGGGSSAAATATLASFTKEVPFKRIITITDTVISAITFPDRVKGGRPAYGGDSGIIGKTLPAGREFHIYGDSITLTSGLSYLLRR